MTRSPILSASNLEAFFKDELSARGKASGLRISTEAQAYVCLKLSRLSAEEARPTEALAPRYLEGIGTSPHSKLRKEKLSVVGNISLFYSGLFWSSLRQRRITDANLRYVMMLGRNAYLLVGEKMFVELGNNFEELVALLTEISLRWKLTNTENPLKLYEAWTLTGNRALRDAIRQKGLPFNSPTGEIKIQ